MEAIMRTITKKKINLLNPQPDEIDIVDIATGLSRIVRFSGQRPHCVTVAQHCIFGSWKVQEEHALAFLLHDASEAYLGDIHGPLKPFLPDYCAIEERLQRVICEKYGVVFPFAEAVHKMDELLRKHEDNYAGAGTTDIGCEWWKEQYLLRFRQLNPEC